MLFNINRTTALILAATTLGASAGWVAKRLSSYGDSEDEATEATMSYGEHRKIVNSWKEQAQEWREEIYTNDNKRVVQLGLLNVQEKLIQLGVLRDETFLPQNFDECKDQALLADMPIEEFLENRAEMFIYACVRNLDNLEHHDDNEPYYRR